MVSLFVFVDIWWLSFNPGLQYNGFSFNATRHKNVYILTKQFEKLKSQFNTDLFSKHGKNGTVYFLFGKMDHCGHQYSNHFIMTEQ